MKNFFFTPFIIVKYLVMKFGMIMREEKIPEENNSHTLNGLSQILAHKTIIHNL